MVLVNLVWDDAQPKRGRRGDIINENDEEIEHLNTNVTFSEGEESEGEDLFEDMGKYEFESLLTVLGIIALLQIQTNTIEKALLAKVKKRKR